MATSSASAIIAEGISSKLRLLAADSPLRLSLAASAATLCISSALFFSPSNRAIQDEVSQQTTRAAPQDDNDEDSSSNAGAVSSRRATSQVPPSQEGSPSSFGTRESLTHLLVLLRIAMPKIASRQGMWLAALTVLLVVRSVLSMRIAKLSGNIATAFVSGSPRSFLVAIGMFVLWTVPTAMVNSGLKYFTGMLQVTFRDHIARHLHARVFQPQVFFRLTGLGLLENVDQRLTQDVSRWSERVCRAYSLIFKPLLDIVLFSSDIATMNQGSYRGPALIGVYFTAVSVLVKLLAPNFGVLTSMQNDKDNLLRAAHLKLLQNAEEVVLSNGEEAERRRVDGLFETTNDHALFTALKVAQNDVFENLWIKYGSIVVGNVVCAIVTSSLISQQAGGGGNVQELTGVYVRLAQMLTNLARSIGQLLSSHRALSTMLSYTNRVYLIESSVQDAEKSVRRLAKMADKKSKESTNGLASQHSNGSRNGSVSSTASLSGGSVETSSYIKFEDVAIVAPNNEVLVDHLNFYVKPGMNVLIIGPNGCGKSSTFRLLAELWPVLQGVIGKPSNEQLYYVPQRPYMSSGTLRDQIIYPLKSRHLKVGESELHRCLELASLDSLLDRPNMHWDSRLIWSGDSALSMGEKQRMALARMFFHKPRFAILDECTSAVDLDVEKRIYEVCAEKGITVMTIAHRKSVWRYHNWVLKFDGNGGYIFSPMKIVNVDRRGDELVASSPSSSPSSSLVGASPRMVDGDGSTMDVTQGAVLVMTKIHSASDPLLVGQEVREYIGCSEIDGSRPVTSRPATPPPPQQRKISFATSPSPSVPR